MKCGILFPFVLASAHAATTIPPLPHDVCQTDAQCLHGGRCQVFKKGQIKSGAGDDYNFCVCREGYGGQRCESYCPLNCLNGGVCHSKGSGTPNTVAAYACKCLGHWAGTVCDIPYENCADGTQCYNGGKCREREEQITANSISRAVNITFCECPPGYGGLSCQAEVELQESDDRVLIKPGTAAFSIFMALVVPGMVGLTFLLYRRRRWAAYSTVELSENSQIEFETSNSGIKQDEKWKNIV
jgi:hypothetical protein